MVLGKVITKLEVQKKNNNRVNVHIDGEYAFSCSSELVYTHALKLNKSVEVEKLKEIADEDNYLKCKNAAMRIIERSYKSEKQVFDKLILKGYDEKIIARTMELLKSYSLLDDEAYTKLYVKEKIKTQGVNKIKFSLIKKGIAKETVDDLLKEVDSSKELTTALSLGEKKYNSLVKTEKDKRTVSKKLWEFLVRNGFSSEIANEVINKVVVLEEDYSEEKIEENSDELYEQAVKRFKSLSKSESDKRKLYKKLGDYLLRRGYSWESIKSVLKVILNTEDFE
jgi:regulatory protein